MSAPTRKPRPSLLAEAALDPVAVGAPPPLPEPAPATEAPPTRRAPKPFKKPASREGAKAITFHVDPDVHVQLKIMAAKTQRPVQDLMIDAVNLLFRENDMARIARQRPRGR